MTNPRGTEHEPGVATGATTLSSVVHGADPNAAEDEISSPRDPQQRTQPPHPAVDLGLAAVLATGLVYAAGWAYAYRWFARFDLGIAGLGVSELGLPVETVLMYGFWTLRVHWYLLLVYGLGLLLWVWHGPRVRLWILRTAPVWLLVAFALAYLAGSQSANDLFERHREAGFGCFPQARVGLVPRGDRSAEIDALAASLAKREYRLLLQTPYLLVLIKPKPQGPPVTAIVPMGSVDAVRLVSTASECAH